jgi:GT2 family glycosyltransferase/SAM-dependent methyltransferase
MLAETTPLLSLILPTRGRPDGLARFLGSVATMTTELNNVEVVLVMDEDDTATLQFEPPDGMRIVKTVVPPGLTMGRLNTAGFDACTGANVMLVNDDILVQTPGWDEQVFDVMRHHPDGVYLIHVNDGIFQERLCTFPLVSRQYCDLAGGICPPEYRRYRIDDHIYNVFNLVSVLGRNRIVYLPEVRFEHYNYVRLEGGSIEYQPDQVIHRHDTELFDGWLERRKDLAVSLLEIVDRHRCGERNQVRRDRLAPITDSVSLRRPEYVQTVARQLTPSTKTDRVTVAVVSADVTGDYARACISALKAFTANFDLVVFDNNRGRGFNHAREMNCLLDQCRTEYLVLLDDDVIVHAGWLDELLRAVGPSVGVVTPAHKNVDGRFSYAGVVMRPDGSGLHSHSFRVGPEARRIQTLCSAALIVDMAKCGSIRFDERYSKYFLDIDYGLRVWEAGYEVLCAPSAMVTHIGGATLNYGTRESTALEEAQRALFVRKWMDTGRYEAIAWTRWQAVPEIASLLEVPSRLYALLERPRVKEVTTFLDKAHDLFDDVRGIPVMQNWVATHVWQAAGERRPTLDDPDAWHLACLLAFTEYVVTIESREGFNVVLSNGEYFAVPPTDGPVDARTLQAANPNRYLRAARRETLQALIAARVAGHAQPQASAPGNRDSRHWLELSPLKRVTTVDGFDVFAFEFKFFAIPTAEGPFDYKQYLGGKYSRCFVGHSVAEVRRKVSASDKVERVLVVTGQCPPTLSRAVERLLAQGHGEHISMLCENGIPSEWATRLRPLDTNGLPADVIQAMARGTSKPIEQLRTHGFTRVMLSWDDPGALQSAVLEQAAARVAPSVEVVFPDGQCRTYLGEDAHRLGYNKAYLASLFSSVPVPAGQDVLEVGCSDGLVCDMMSHLGARSVTGVDVMQTTGCAYPGDRIRYQSMDATRLMFRDGSFDLVYSIATFEHLPHPTQTLEEIVRVLRPGGIGYVQAGPLYFSPFGHHMFAYFGDQPWIHLRRSKKRILGYAAKRGIDERVAEDFGLTMIEYLDQMLSSDHINGLSLSEYGLDVFRRRPDVEILKFNVSREGEDLLTPQIEAEIGGILPERLTQHGFEILFRRRQ